MPYVFSDEQEQIRSEVRRVLAATSRPETLRGLLEARGQYDADFWRVAREMGWTAMAVSEADGGLGMSIHDALIVAEECGRAVVGAPFLATGFAASHLLSRCGEQSVWLSKIAAGEAIAAIAFAEGSEILPGSITARLEGGKLTGEKIAILGGSVANVAIVLARDENGDCLALVNLDNEGVVRTQLETIDNSRCTATLCFRNVDAERLSTDAPIDLARDALGRLALFQASEAVGGTDSCIALAVDYANQRQAFGQAIGKFQAVKHSIAETYVLNELARASVSDAAVQIESGATDTNAYIAAARLNALQAYEFGSATATYIHGGIGATWEADLHLHYRRSRTLAIEAGAAAYWEDRIFEILEAA